MPPSCLPSTAAALKKVCAGTRLLLLLSPVAEASKGWSGGGLWSSLSPSPAHFHVFIWRLAAFILLKFMISDTEFMLFCIRKGAGGELAGARGAGA